MPALEKEYYDLVDSLCTVEQVKDVLREYKADYGTDVRVTAPDKATLIASNLANAVDAGIVPAHRVFELIRSSEENGNQHVFYFKAGTDSIRARLRRGRDVIAPHLWGEQWETTTGFPKPNLVPNEYVWADFRPGKQGRGMDWVAKLYGHESVERFTGEIEEQGRYIYRQYEVVDERVVCVARWNDPDLLELRVPRATSKKLISRRLRTLTEALAPAIDAADIVPWDLAAARKNLLRRQDQHRSVYDLGDTRLRDSAHGTALFHPYTEEEDLFTAIERHDAVELLLRQGDCEQLTVRWLPRGPVQEMVRAVIGALAPNEVNILPQTSPEVVDYVTDQLRSFNR